MFFLLIENVSDLCIYSSVISEQSKCVLPYLDALNLHAKCQDAKMQWEVRIVAASKGNSGGSMKGIRSVVTTLTWHTAGQPGPDRSFSLAALLYLVYVLRR
jgi:hypothetical protein